MNNLSKRLTELSPEKRELVLKKLQKQTLIPEKDRSRQAPPIVAISRDQPIPLSFSQEQLWFLDQLNPGLTAYNIPFDLGLSGPLNVAVLEQSIHEIVQRHEVLRTTFRVVDGQPVQFIAPTLTIPLSKIDLRHFPKNEREPEVQRLALEEAKCSFDLKEGPLFRTTLLQLDKEEHVLLTTTHHIVYDGLSIGVFMQELAVLYEAFCAGKPSPLPKLYVQYADFAQWQRERLQGEVLEQLLSYWKPRLSEDLPFLDIPVDHPRPANQTFQGDSLFFVLSQPLSEAIRLLSQQEKVTVFVTLLVAFKALLYRYTGQQDIIVGSDISNRNQPELENLIGFFVNTVVLRTNLSGDPTFRELLERVRNVSLEAQEHRDMPFNRLVSELRPDRELSRQSLFQVMFDLQSLSLRLPNLAGIKLKPMFVPNGGSKFDINIEMIDTLQGLSGTWEYNTNLFETVTMNRMIEHFQSLLEVVVTNPDQRISEIPLLSDTERHQLLVEWNATQTEFPRDKCFHQLFECQAEDTPDTVAVICGDQKLTYHELNARANRLARILREHGAGPDIVVALLAERGIEFLITILAIFKAGAAYLPLDPHHPKNRILQVLGQSESPLVLAETKFKPLLLEVIEELPSEKPPQVLLLEELLQQNRSGENLPVYCTPGDLAYVIYTSGSTGAPKGAMLEHRGMLNHLYAKILDLKLTGNDIIAQTASQCFDISVWQFLAALLVGGQVHIFDDEIVYNPSLLLEQIDRHGITIFETVPSLLRMILEGIALSGSLRYKLSQLRWLVPTGEALPPELSRQWLHYYPDIPLLNAYGPTECSDDVTHYPIYQPPSDEVFNMPIGRPIANMQMYILDSRLQPVPRGVIGELYVGGIGVGRGYLNDPERTAETFIPDPFSQKPNSRLYKTGDIARYLPDGNIEFLGRVDHQVKIRGFRIELGEITTVLNQHPSVHEAVVIAREDHPGDKRLVAYLVQNPETSVILDGLRQYLKEKLPEYMMPSAFVPLEALPLTPNGKIDRRALPAPEAVMSQQDEEQSIIGPRNPVERIILEIWLDLLKRESIGIHDNFFDLGGHSLLAIQLVTTLSKTLKQNIAVQILFQYPTISELAEVIGERTTASDVSVPASPPLQVEAEQPPSVASISPSLFQFDHRNLLTLYAAGKLGTFDSVALDYLYSPWLGHNEAARDEMLHNWCEGLPTLYNVTETEWGRIAEIMVPLFDSDLYLYQEELIASLIEALEIAKYLGVRSVSLTGLLPSATDYGRHLLRAISDRDDLPEITTGHETTCAAVGLNIRRILREAGRNLSQERVGFLGLGSIGMSSLYLMLHCLPHPREILLCDVYNKLDFLENFQQDLAQKAGFQGCCRVIASGTEVPPEFYESSLIIGATNVADVLDIARLRPGTMIVDDSAPHCFSLELATQRFETQGDILFTEGGVMRAPQPIRDIIYLPQRIRKFLTPEHLVQSVFIKASPHDIVSCAFAGLLHACFDDLPATIGLVDKDVALQYYKVLDHLGVQGADLHCRTYRLPEAVILNFRRNFGQDEHI